MQAIIRSMVILAVFLGTSLPVSAAPKQSPANMKVEKNIMTTLQANTGHYAFVYLKSGHTVVGTIGAVAKGQVLIQQVKDITYYDALIPVKEIAALLLQVRGFK